MLLHIRHAALTSTPCTESGDIVGPFHLSTFPLPGPRGDSAAEVSMLFVSKFAALDKLLTLPFAEGVM